MDIETDFDLKAYLKKQQDIVNRALQSYLTDPEARITKAMEHSLMAGGKRIRPVLCIAAAEAVGGNSDDVIPAACAIEMIHTYSLIHDDLPAMDDDDLRRGIPTCHRAFDEATAVLAGDALLTLAFEVLSGGIKGVDSKDILKVIGIIAEAAGRNKMIEGQMRDILNEGKLISLAALKEMHTMKTGAMIEASVRTGAILGGGSEEQIRFLSEYADKIGLAFQVTDDLLNVEGDPEIMGKAVGTDEKRDKSTYPNLMGIEASREFSADLINSALKAVEKFDNKAVPLRKIAEYIIERKR